MFRKIENKWRDGLEAGGRRPRLLLVAPDGAVVRFAGESIPGMLAVVGEQYEKNGKWSATTRSLRLANGVVAIKCLMPLHQTLAQFGTWAAFRAAFEAAAGRPVNPASFEAVARAAWPQRDGWGTEGVGHLDAAEAALAALAPG